MLFRKLASSLKPAALATAFAFGFESALPAFAQSEIEPTLKASDARGTAVGTWVPATVSANGSMHGLMIDQRGNVRFEIAAVTHRIVPSEIPGYQIGSLYGRLLSPRLEEAPVVDPKAVATKPTLETASIYLVGHWSVNESDGAGSFAAVAYVNLAPLPLPLVLLDLGGSFRVATNNSALPPGETAVVAPVIPPQFVVCYAHPDLYSPSARLALRAERMGIAAPALQLGALQAGTQQAGQTRAALVINATGNTRFFGRWATRD